jgi:NADPH-dependent 2,4-dienoyl-CoA reductase/sulfur reductase-like enzyme
MVGMTRAHMADPHIASKIAAGQEARIRPCVGMGYCIDSIYSGEAVCIHNPATGREAVLPHVVSRSTGPVRRVVVVGAGPGGLEAARVAGERGHEVLVLEAGSEAGGQVRLAAGLARRREILGITDWRMAECARLGVRFRFDCLAGAEEVLAEAPDLVVVATGGLPDLSFLDAGADLATSAWEVLAGSVPATGTMLLYDDNGAHPGLSTAEYLAGRGADLEYITPERMLGPDVGGTNYPAYLKALSLGRVRVTLNLRLERIERRGNGLAATFHDEYAETRVERLADRVVVEHGTLPNDSLYFDLQPGARNLGAVDYRAFLAGRPQAVVTNPAGRYDLYRIGDAVAGRNIHAAIHDALRLLKEC